MRSRPVVVPVVPLTPFLLNAAEGPAVLAALSCVVGVTPRSVASPTPPRHATMAVRMVGFSPPSHDGRQHAVRTGHVYRRLSGPSKGRYTT